MGTLHPEDLKGNLLFANLGLEQIAAILEISTVEEYASGEVVFRQDDEAKTLYVVEKGLVAMVLNVMPNKELTIVTESKGGAFGWAAVIPPHQRSSSAKCFEPSRLLAIEGEKVRALCLREPDLGMKFMTGLAQFIASRLRDTTLVALEAM
jgi:CRP-like cAMP-binding protein